MSNSYAAPESGLLLSRRSKEYIDISLASFGSPNPLNGDLTTIKNEVAINNAIKNIVLFLPTEVPFNRDIGSTVTNYLFDLVDDATAGLLVQEIKRAINFCEPRVTFLPFAKSGTIDYSDFINPNFEEDKAYGYGRNITESQNLGVYVDARPDQNEFQVTIVYRIIGDEKIFRVQQILTPTR